MSNVLIIDDDSLMLNAIRVILQKEGKYKVDVAGDGQTAMYKLENQRYDIVLTDLMMPYFSGLDFVAKIRSDSSNNNVGIIVLSSVGNEETITEVFRLGADEYLKKPIMAKELLMRVSNLIKSKKSS